MLSRLILLTFFISTNALAFNIKTHTYIGNEVIEDLKDDGRLTIPPFGTFTVDTKISQSILSYPEVYLLGTLGPDSVPDMIGGQITTHAGVDGGWVTDDWLKHLAVQNGNSPEEVAWQAFYKGYLSHAASDIFAHTYVNTYAGNKFLLADEDHLDVEARHFILESYIARFQPHDIPSDMIFGAVGYHTRYVDTGELEPAMGPFSLQQLTENTTKHLRKELAILQFVGHLSDDNYSASLQYVDSLQPNIDTKEALRDLIDWLYSRRYIISSVFENRYNLVRDGDYGIYTRIVEKRVFANSSDWDETFTRKITDRLIRDNSVSEQYRLGGLTSYLHKMDKYEERVKEEAKFINVLKAWIKDELGKELERQALINDLIERYAQDARVVEHAPKIQNVNSHLPVCFYGQTSNCINQSDLPICDTRHLEHAVARLNDPQVYDLWLAEYCRDILISRYSQELIGKSIDNLFSEYPEFLERGRELELTRLSSDETVQKLALITAAIVFYETLDYEALLLQLALAKYLEHSVVDATEAYVFSNIETAKAIYEKKNIDETVQPLKNWLICYGPVYTHEYAAVMPEVCSLSDEARRLADAFQVKLRETGEYLAQQTGTADEALAMYQSYQSFKSKMEALARDLGKDIVKDVLSDEHEAFLRILVSEADDVTLNATYIRDGHGVNLLQIPDMVDRVKADMHLDSNNKFNPEEFSPVFNAIQLSKLALLSEAEINRIETLAGVYQINYKNSYSGVDFNILYSWISSLDGNHQWMNHSPRYPRQAGHDDTSSSDERKYSVGEGLDIWSSNNHRDKVFEKLFKGPVSESLEYPESVGQPALIPSYYKTRSCETNPFPIGEDVERCLPIAAWLIPVLYLLN